MIKSFKYQIYPTDIQKSMLISMFGNVRFVYNLGLETKKLVYSNYQKSLSYEDLANQIKDLKDNECQWLKETPAQAIQSTLRNLDTAYKNFYMHKKGFPKFKNKNSKQSFQLPQNVRLSINNKQIHLPKLKWINICVHRTFKGKIKTVTVSMTKTGKFMISLLVDNNSNKLPIKKNIKKETTVGIDLGIKDFAITSDGKKFENQGFLKSELKRLRVEQRSLARKVKGSNSWKRQRLILALLYERIMNKRLDHHHKLSKWFINNYDTICLEDLAVANMMKNQKLARSILDVSWSEFVRQLTYKAEWYGKNIVKIGRFEPSSKTCSNCGHIKQDLTLSYRVWTCESCGLTHDRDVNAAKNIKNMGLKKLVNIKNRQGYVGCER